MLKLFKIIETTNIETPVVSGHWNYKWNSLADKHTFAINPCKQLPF